MRWWPAIALSLALSLWILSGCAPEPEEPEEPPPPETSEDPPPDPETSEDPPPDPETGEDPPPDPKPSVSLTDPPSGDVFSAVTADAGSKVEIKWNATAGTTINLYLSLDNGMTWKAIAIGLAAADGKFDWYPPNLPTDAASAHIRVEAIDDEGDFRHATSPAFHLKTAPVRAGKTTLRDFFQPGSQPGHHMVTFELPINEVAVQKPNGSPILPVAKCTGGTCHNWPNPDNDSDASDGDAVLSNIWETWRGSMMAHASIDPLFDACLEIAEQDAPESGDLCLRCHTPKAWLSGRSTPTDGSAIPLNEDEVATDREGVSCEICHRMVDPASIEPVDLLILQDLDKGGTNHQPTEDDTVLYGNGMYVIDRDVEGPNKSRKYDGRRGPFPPGPVNEDGNEITHQHTLVFSPFHQTGEFCGTCHDVSNPQLDIEQPDGSFVGAENRQAISFKPSRLMPIERTFSEWKASTYATTGVSSVPFGVPQVATVVGTCQDCHMPDLDVANGATARACKATFKDDDGDGDVEQTRGGLARSDFPIHDLTGGNTWIPRVLQDPRFGLDVDTHDALDRAVIRARYMLQHAATVTLEQQGPTRLSVRVQNETGHKLPTGYPEGRRMWINVQFLDDGDELLKEINAYNDSTAFLEHADPESTIYEAKLIRTSDNEHFHFVQSNKVEKDNRIPPRGYVKTTFEGFHAEPQPDPNRYADGQFWDSTDYTIPDCAVRAEVRVYYQTASRDYIEFLRDENQKPDHGAGGRMYDLWEKYDRSPPEVLGWTTSTGGVADPHEIALSDFDPDFRPVLCRVWSKKVHGPGGERFIDVLNGAAEPRTTGPDKRLELHAFFDRALKSGNDLGNAVVDAGVGTVDTVSLGPDGKEVIIKLKDVSNGQCLSLRLTGFKDLSGGAVMPDKAFSVPVLFGDASETPDQAAPNVFGVTQVRDVEEAKTLSGLPIGDDTFRYDVNLSGAITVADIGQITNQTGALMICAP